MKVFKWKYVFFYAFLPQMDAFIRLLSVEIPVLQRGIFPSKDFITAFCVYFLSKHFVDKGDIITPQSYIF